MSANIILEVILLALALSMDAFAVSISNGLTISNLNKKKTLFISLTFGVFQALMPLAGFFIVELITWIAGETAGLEAGNIASLVVTWVGFSLLLIIGAKMIFESIKNLKSKESYEEKKLFSIKEILVYGIATSIDALAAGVAMHADMSTISTIWLHVSIILSLTFILSLIGLLLGKKIVKLFKGKQEICGVIGGFILLLLAVWVVLSHYLGI